MIFGIVTEIQYFSDQHSESQRKLEINTAEVTSQANRSLGLYPPYLAGSESFLTIVFCIDLSRVER